MVVEPEYLPGTHDHPELVLPPLGHHVHDAGELEHEEAGVVRHVCVRAAEQVHRPHVEELLSPSANPELQFGAEHLGSVQLLEVSAWWEIW